jgi:hypothetical protein
MFTPIFRRSNCLTLPVVSNPVIVVVMSESREDLLKMGENTPETC